MENMYTDGKALTVKRLVVIGSYENQFITSFFYSVLIS